VEPFVVRKCGSLAGGSAGNQKVYAGFHLPRHQIAQRSLIYRTILMKWCNQCRTAAAELHVNKITRMSLCGNGEDYNSRQTSLKS
jgi:hypothetical protein